MYNINIEFEYDEWKSRANVIKHGISFEDAKQLWLVSHLELAARELSEKRYMLIGELGGRFFTCIYTCRGSKLRIISVRRSRVKEELAYHERIEKKEKNNS